MALKIRDATGRWARVIEERDNTYIVDKPWQFVHKDNVTAQIEVFWSETLKRYVTIPED